MRSCATVDLKMWRGFGAGIMVATAGWPWVAHVKPEACFMHCLGVDFEAAAILMWQSTVVRCSPELVSCPSCPVTCGRLNAPAVC